MPTTLEDRLARLERAYSRSRRRQFGLVALVVALTSVSALPMSSESQGTSPVLRARVLEIVNDEDATVARLWADPRGHGLLDLRTRTGQPVVIQGVNTLGHGYLSLMTGQGKSACGLGANEQGDGVVLVKTAQGVSRAFMAKD